MKYYRIFVPIEEGGIKAYMVKADTPEEACLKLHQAKKVLFYLSLTAEEVKFEDDIMLVNSF